MENPFEILESKICEINKKLDSIEEYLSFLPKKTKNEINKISIQDIFKRKILSKPTFYKYVKQGKINIYKLGGRSYIDVNEFNNGFIKQKLYKNEESI